MSDNIIAEFESKDGQTTVVARDQTDFSPLDPPPTYTVTVDGRVTQQSITAEEAIGYLALRAHNEAFVADRPFPIGFRAKKERVDEVLQQYRLGNLTKLGVCNALTRLGMRSDRAIDLANGLGERVAYEITAYCPTEPDNCTLNREDGGAALIFEPAFADAEAMAEKRFLEDTDREHGIHVRVISYDERVWAENGADPNAHDEFAKLLGKRVRVTVEVLD